MTMGRTVSQTYSVVIPAYNAARTIGEALESVFAQTCSPNDVVVSDDGSTDDLAAAVRGFDVTIIRGENTGPGGATTRGVDAAKGSLIATLDADDIWLPNKMAIQLDCLAKRPSLGAVFCRLAARYETQKATVDDTKSGWLRTTMVVRRSAWDQVGPMVDLPSYIGEMIDWVDRARLANVDLHLIEETLACRRIHDQSLTYTRAAEARRSYALLARQSILRRRSELSL